MNTKIDISSLDKTTKNKIKRTQKRCEELGEGVKKSATIKVNFEVNWTEGEECKIIDIGPDIPGIHFEIDFDYIDDIMDEFKNKVDAEIKDIMSFSDKIADQLGVDRIEFFEQYFAC